MFDEFEQASDAAAVRLDDVPSGGAHSLPLFRFGEKSLQNGGQLSRIRHLQRGASLD